jgi:hypothetical protein
MVPAAITIFLVNYNNHKSSPITQSLVPTPGEEKLILNLENITEAALTLGLQVQVLWSIQRSSEFLSLININSLI